MQNKKTIGIGVILLAAIVLGYTGWVFYANKALRDVVDASLARLEQHLEANGDEATVSYDDVRIHGFSVRPRASVYKIHIKVEDKHRQREMHLDLPEVVYTPNSFNMRSYSLEVVDSVSWVMQRRGEETRSVMVDFSSTPKLHVAQGGKVVKYAIDAPRHITFTDISEADEEGDEVKTDIVFASAPQIEWGVMEGGISLDQKAVFPHITIKQDEGTLLEVDGINIETRHSNVEDGAHRYVTLLKLDNLNFHVDALEPFNPISLASDTIYTGPVLSDKSAEKKDAPRRVELKNIAWMSGLHSVFINGTVEHKPVEDLPFGTVNIRLDDVDALFTYLGENEEEIAGFLTKLRAALEKMAGQTVEEGASFNITIERKPEGRLYVGKLTLEETLMVAFDLLLNLPEVSLEEALEKKSGLDEDASEDAVESLREEVEDTLEEAQDAVEDAVEDTAKEKSPSAQEKPASLPVDTHIKEEDTNQEQAPLDAPEPAVTPKTSPDAEVMPYGENKDTSTIPVL